MIIDERALQEAKSEWRKYAYPEDEVSALLVSVGERLGRGFGRGHFSVGAVQAGDDFGDVEEIGDVGGILHPIIAWLIEL